MDGRTDGRTEGQTEGRKAENYVPPLFFEKAGDNNSIATVIENTNQICRYYMQKLKRLYINTPIIIDFVYPSREPATRIEQ